LAYGFAAASAEPLSGMGVGPLSTQACCCGTGDPDGCVEQLRHGRVVDQQQGAAGIASLAKNKAQRRSQWMNDAVPLLVEAVATGETMELREHAARALANLPMCEMSNAESIVAAGGVPPLVDLMSADSYGCRAQAARAVGNLCVASKDAARGALQAGVVRPLLAALLTEDPAVHGINLAVEAALALANFASADDCCCDAVLQSPVVVPGLQNLAISEDAQTRAAALRALTSLALVSGRAKQALEVLRRDERQLQATSEKMNPENTSERCKVYGRQGRPVATPMM